MVSQQHKLPVTQVTDNALALMAIGKYLHVVSSGTNAVSAEVSWQAQTGLVARAVDDKQERWFAPEPSEGPLTIKNSGPGILYYSWTSSGISAQGEAPEADDNIHLGDCVVTELPANLPERSPIQVWLNFETNGRVSVVALEMTGGHLAHAEIERRAGLKEADIAREQKFVAGLRIG